MKVQHTAILFMDESSLHVSYIYIITNPDMLWRFDRLMANDHYEIALAKLNIDKIIVYLKQLNVLALIIDSSHIYISTKKIHLS